MKRLLHFRHLRYRVAQKNGPLATVSQKETNVAQVSVATGLTFYGIFNGDSIRLLLLSLAVKKSEKSASS